MTTPSTIHLIVGARPNFMKIAPLYKALACQPEVFRALIVHTGQHYDFNMSDTFFQDFGLPEPHVYLGVGSSTHAQQTAKIMMAYEEACLIHRPNWVIVVGDVNSTLACGLVAKKLALPLAHLEAGLRSFDRTMPEEINRIVIDALSDLLWTPSEDADDNLALEGISKDRILRVGNIMIDALEMMRPAIEARNACRKFELTPQQYGLVTLHRPTNVDNPKRLMRLIRTLTQAAEQLPLVFSVHPRTKSRLKQLGLWRIIEKPSHLRIIDSLGYVDFLSLLFQSVLVITDSGGLQEETTYLKIPCLTLRENTERPITMTKGTNRLVSVETLLENINIVLKGYWKKGSIPSLWDGKTAYRVVNNLKENLYID